MSGDPSPTASDVTSTLPGPNTDPNAWLSAWTPRGADAHDGRAMTADAAAAATALGVQGGDVHILFAGTIEGTSSVVVAAAVCQTCQAPGGPSVNVVVLRVQNSHAVASMTAEGVPLGPGIGVFPFPTTQGLWSVAVVVAPGVIGAQVQYTSGTPWLDVNLDQVNGLGTIATLPDPAIDIHVRLLGANNVVLADQQLPSWIVHGPWPGGLGSDNGVGNGSDQHGFPAPWRS